MGIIIPTSILLYFQQPSVCERSGGIGNIKDSDVLRMHVKYTTMNKVKYFS